MKLPALNKVPLRNGTVRIYAWRGPKAPAILSPPGTPEFQAERERLVRARGVPVLDFKVPTTFGELITAYQDSMTYAKLRPSTKVHYDRYISIILPLFGDMPLSMWSTAPGRFTVKKLVEKWHQAEVKKVAENNQTGCDLDHIVVMLKLLGNFAWKCGVFSENWHPFINLPLIYKAQRTESIWTPENEETFYSQAKPRWRMALLLAIYTGQREGDLVRMVYSTSQPISDTNGPVPYFDGEWFHIRQSKTGALVDVPAIDPLRSALMAAGFREGDNLIQTFHGRAWRSARNFSSEFASAKNKIPSLSHLHFHDARGTAVTRLYEAGVRDPHMLGAITGHSAKHASEILHRFYLANRAGRARKAMGRWSTRISNRAGSPVRSDPN